MDNNDLVPRESVRDILADEVRIANADEERIIVRINYRVKAIPAVDAVEVSGATKHAVELIVEERRRQTALWGVQNRIHMFEWMSILGEEYGELCQAVNETVFQKPRHPERGGIDAIRREAVQVAAVAAQIIEACMDGRREDGDV